MDTKVLTFVEEEYDNEIGIFYARFDISDETDKKLWLADEDIIANTFLAAITSIPELRSYTLRKACRDWQVMGCGWHLENISEDKFIDLGHELCIFKIETNDPRAKTHRKEIYQIMNDIIAKV